MRTDNIKLCDARFYRSNPGHSVGSPSPLSVMTFVLSSSVFHSTLILSLVGNVVEYGTISFFCFCFSLTCQAILAAVVVVALKGLFRQFNRLVQLWRMCKPDAVS